MISITESDKQKFDPKAHLKWANVKLDYVGNSSMGTFGCHQLCIKIYSDIIKLFWLIGSFHVPLVPKKLLDPITEWPHKIFSEQPEVRVQVEVGVCVALRGEVGSKEGLLVLMELLWSWVDGYGPEILLLFFTWVGNSCCCFNKTVGRVLKCKKKKKQPQH